MAQLELVGVAGVVRVDRDVPQPVEVDGALARGCGHEVLVGTRVDLLAGFLGRIASREEDLELESLVDPAALRNDESRLELLVEAPGARLVDGPADHVRVNGLQVIFSCLCGGCRQGEVACHHSDDRDD